MYTFVDMRERVLTVAPQEVLTSDSVSLRVTMAIRAAVVDAAAFTERTSEPWTVVYLAAQVALREVCAAVSVDEVITRADTVGTEPIKAATANAGQSVGIDVRDVVIKEVILPAEIRSAATELVTAKARGLAKLETARAETRLIDAEGLAERTTLTDGNTNTVVAAALSDCIRTLLPPPPGVVAWYGQHEAHRLALADWAYASGTVRPLTSTPPSTPFREPWQRQQAGGGRSTTAPRSTRSTEP